MTYITHWRPTIIHMRASRKTGRHSHTAQRLYKRQTNSAVVACDPILLPAWSESKIKVSEVTCKWCWHVWDEIQLCHLWCEIIFGFKVLTPGEPPIFLIRKSPTQQSWRVRDLRLEPSQLQPLTEPDGVKAGCKTFRPSLMDVSLTLS